VDRFFRAVGKIGGAERTDVIEKDYHLHSLLLEISKDPYLKGNLAFKGGTCLVKAYSGYYRFSEDIDFTWADQVRWSSVTANQRNGLCADEAENVIHHLKDITDRVGLSFSGKKGGPDVHISSRGKMLTIYPSYISALSRIKANVKIEVNFFDINAFPYQDKVLGTYMSGSDFQELETFHEEQYRTYSAPVEMTCYDCREIFIEKCRAMMTRKVYKPRDSLDLYHLGQTRGLKVPLYKDEIIRKVRFALGTYERYWENIIDNDISKIDYDRRDDNLLLVDMPIDIDAAIGEIHRELENIRADIVSMIGRD